MLSLKAVVTDIIIDVIPNLNENEYYFYYVLRKSISVLGIC